MIKTKRQLAQARYYQKHKRPLQTKARKRSRQRPVSYRLCKGCGKIIRKAGWAVSWKPITVCGVWLGAVKRGFYHRICLYNAIRHAVIRWTKGDCIEVVTQRGYKKTMTPEKFAEEVLEVARGKDVFGKVLQSFRNISL